MTMCAPDLQLQMAAVRTRRRTMTLPGIRHVMEPRGNLETRGSAAQQTCLLQYLTAAIKS